MNYVNSIQMRVSGYDFQFVLGQAAHIVEGGRVIVGNLLTVVMSPQHAKALSEMLTKNISAYEEIFGPVATPVVIQQPASTAPAQPSSRSRSAQKQKA